MRKRLAGLSGLGILFALTWMLVTTQSSLDAPPFGNPATSWPTESEAFSIAPGPIQEQVIARFFCDPVGKTVVLDEPARETIPTLPLKRTGEVEVALAEPKVDDIPTPPRPEPVRPPVVAVEVKPFADWPVGASKTVDFLLEEATRTRLSPQAQEDALRDGLLSTLAANAGLTHDGWPRARLRGSGGAIVNAKDSPTRSCLLSDDRVIALLPKCEGPERKVHLARVADGARKSLGAKPGTLVVFEYELRADKLLGSLIRREDVAGDGLFSPAFGYHESRIAGEGDLTAFTAKVREIVHAEQSDPSEPVFVLGGRKLPGHTSRGLPVEQVAVIVRAEREIHQKWDALQSHWRQEVASFQKHWSTRVDEYQRRWELLEVALGIGRGAMTLDELKEEAKEEARQIRAERDLKWKELEERRQGDYRRVRQELDERLRKVPGEAARAWRALLGS